MTMLVWTMNKSDLMNSREEKIGLQKQDISVLNTIPSSFAHFQESDNLATR